MSHIENVFSRFSAMMQRTDVILATFIIFIVALVIAGQCNTSFAVFWAAPSVGLDGQTFSYSMWGGISKLLERKTYGIAWLLIIFSGLWPIIKLLLLLLVTIFPQHPLLSQSRRYAILTNLCQFGRFSYIDVWVVSLIILTIRIDQAALPGLNIEFWVQAVGEKGATLFLTAITFSQILSGFLLTSRHKREFERRNLLQEPQFSQLAADDSNEESLNVWDEEAPDGAGSDEKSSFKDSFSLFQGIQLQAVIVTWSMLVLVAVFIPCYSISYTAASQVFDSPSYSMLTGFTTIGVNNHPSTYAHAPSPGVLAFAGVMLVILFPILQVVLMCTIWFLPMRLSYHTTLHLWLDNITHFASMDTFIFSLTIVSWEVGSLLSTSELSDYVQITMRPNGAFFFVAFVAFIFSPLVGYFLLRHRMFLLEKGVLRAPLLQ